MDCWHQLMSSQYSCNYSYAYRSIMGNGKIHELTEKEAKITALTRILNHTAPDAKIDFLADTLDRTAVYQIDVEYFTGKERPLPN